MNTAAAVATAAARPFIAVVCCTFGLLASGPAFATSPAPPAAIQEAHSAVWFDAENPGTGWVLEMLRNDRGAVYWYGFDEAGQPVWRIGAGRVEGDGLSGRSLIVDDLYAGSGARFGAAFDPDDVVLERVGSAAMSFRDCDSGSVTVETEAGMTTEPLDRLTETMGAGRPPCRGLNGEPGIVVQPYAGESGTWYDPERDGEGITLQWMARDEAVLYWFTYDLDGNPLWLFGVGAREADGLVVFPLLYTATRSEAGEVALSDWGSAALDLECNSGTLTWTARDVGFGEGSRSLTRLNALASPACPTLTPGLDDHYDLQARFLPVPPGRDIEPRDIADDGTVLGLERTADGPRLVVLAPEPGAIWVAFDGGRDAAPPVDEFGRHLLVEGATQAIAGARSGPLSAQPARFAPEFNSMLPDFGPGDYRLEGASADRTVLTGRRDDGAAWSWSEASGLRLLALPESSSAEFATASAAADARDVVIGFESYPIIGTPVPGPYFPGVVALRWVDGKADYLRDPDGRLLGSPRLCSADCNVVYGADVNDIEFPGPRVRQPWFWTTDGRFGVLEGLEFQSIYLRHTVVDTTGDGTLVLGTSRDVRDERMPPVSPPPPPREAFVWTQATGLVNLSALLEELGLVDDVQSSAGVALSNGGLLLTVNGAPLVLEIERKP